MADFNGDGSPDLAASSGARISILLNSGSGPAAVLLPGAVSFGDEGIGFTSPARTLTLSNTGSSRLDITGIAISGPQRTNFAQTHTCGATLASGAKCSFSITFSPQSPGLQNASIQITDNAFNSPQVIPLTGSGAPPLSAASLTPTTLDFGNEFVGSTSATRTVILSSTGNVPLHITSIALQGQNADDFSASQSCANPLNNGSGCVITVTFSPKAPGTRSANLTVTDAALNSPQTVAITGTGQTPGPGLGLPPGGADTATVSAGGTATYTLSVGGAGIAGTVSLTCTGVPPGANCSVPGTVAINSVTPENFNVSVKTTSRTIASLSPVPNTHNSRWFWASAMLASLLLSFPVGGGRCNRRLLVLLVILPLCSCGGNGGPKENPNGTPPGNYVLTVTASLGSQTQSTTLNLIVQ